MSSRILGMQAGYSAIVLVLVAALQQASARRAIGVSPKGIMSQKEHFRGNLGVTVLILALGRDENRTGPRLIFERTGCYLHQSLGHPPDVLQQMGRKQEWINKIITDIRWTT
jgi:hypothetical protein